jgi:hypothetical protein
MKKIEILTLALMAGVVVAIVWSVVGEPLFHRGRNRGQVVALYEKLQTGMTKEQAQHVIDSGEYPNLRFDRVHQVNDDRWYVSSPLEFVAKNWILWVEFSAGGVSALRIRTPDGDWDHPPEAPPDKTSTSGHGLPRVANVPIEP